MTQWIPMKTDELYKGATGYVSFTLTARKETVMIICEVLDIRVSSVGGFTSHVEVSPISGDRICLWINVGEICHKLSS